MDEIRQILKEVEEMHPYRIPSIRESYDKYAEGWTDAVNEIESRLPDVPDTNIGNMISRQAAPEQKKGQWIIFDSDNERYEVIKCSKCGFLFTVDASMWCDIGQTKEDFIHCPHCGVKMEGA